MSKAQAARGGRPAKPRPTRSELARLYVVEGRAVRDVATVLGVSKDLVSRALAEYGLKRRPNVKRSKLRAHDPGAILGKVETLGFLGAAEALGVDASTLRRFMAARGRE